MRLALIAIGLIGLFFISTSMVLAKGSQESKNRWDEEKIYLKSIVNDVDACEKNWELLWKRSKEGNLEARYYLLTLLAPPPELMPMYMPGNKGNSITTLRDVLIIAIHSIDYRSETDAYRYYKKLTLNLIKQFKLDTSIGGKEFIRCVENDESNDCSTIAVNGGVVPDFSTYAEDIDSLIESGRSITCN